MISANKTEMKEADKPAAGKSRRKRTPAPVLSAEQKAQAVLAVWTERARPSEVCRQLSVNWVTFSQWQQRAMRGMLQALESRINLASGEALNPRLRALLSNRNHGVATARLSARLEKLQQQPVKARPEPENHTP